MENKENKQHKNEGQPKGKGPKMPKKTEMKRDFIKNIILIFVFLGILVVSYPYLTSTSDKKTDVNLSELARDIKEAKVTSLTVEGDTVTAKYADSTEKTSKKEVESSLSQTMFNYGVTGDELSKVNIDVKSDTGFIFWFANLAPIILPILFILLFVWYLSRSMRGAGAQAFSFGQSRARLTSPEDGKQKVTFKDVAGAKEAKEELSEIVDFLKNPKKFLDIGARIPKGILLMGQPGTGKTLLARAVAGEAGVSFFSVSGAEFVEMFVGVGASRVRDLFKMAKATAPAIIFIDEIDAVGRVRGVGTGGGNDEREQTLNQILVEMDGFEPNEKVIVMAATNRADVLDPALLRPGRFDRRVTIDLPDRKDREEILRVHSREKPFAEDVNLPLIAERTPGFSGADLQSLMNEGAILAARENRTKVAQYDLIRSIEKVMMGPERKSHLLSKKEKELTAYHEAGHALVASVLPYADPVHKISIISRGRAAGYTMKLPLEDKKMQSRNEFLDDIAMSLGGYVVEKMIYGDVTTGPSNDLQVSTALARDMVTKYGMSDKLGPIALEGAGGRVLFGRGVEDNGYSERVSAEIDSEVSLIIHNALKKAEDIVIKYRNVLEAITRRLIEVEVIEQAEYESIIVAHGIPLKKKETIEEGKAEIVA
ncbi:MAG: ftsH [Candidatus Taylorbacteria bacterium]|nr:ftsH [Candidatus Taylorbacteria bacterium]